MGWKENVSFKEITKAPDYGEKPAWKKNNKGTRDKCVGWKSRSLSPPKAEEISSTSASSSFGQVMGLPCLSCYMIRYQLRSWMRSELLRERNKKKDRWAGWRPRHLEKTHPAPRGMGTLAVSVGLTAAWKRLSRPSIGHLLDGDSLGCPPRRAAQLPAKVSQLGADLCLSPSRVSPSSAPLPRGPRRQISAHGCHLANPPRLSCPACSG